MNIRELLPWPLAPGFYNEHSDNHKSIEARMHSQRQKTQEQVIYDETDPCPYLPGEMARMPLRYRALPLSAEEFDTRMELGERRSGPFMYRPQCASCRACEAIRLPVSEFQPTRTQRRVWKRGLQTLDVEVLKPQCDHARIDLFNQHRFQRDLAHGERAVDEEGYRMFLTESCCDSWEIDYRVDGQLIGVAICDRGAESLSAVYCYYDPAESARSLGVFSVLMHLELCRRWNLQHLYLGFFIAACNHMNYKSGYKPHERLVDGQWKRFERER